MTPNPHHYRDLLTAETAHLSLRERMAITACLCLGQHLAASISPDADHAAATDALATKLMTLLDHPPERWVRVLVAKAALEEPVTRRGLFDEDRHVATANAYLQAA